MIIPYKTNEALNEEYNNICDLILQESLSAFENQYAVVKEISPIILDMYKKHITDNVIKVETKSPIKEVQVSVNKNLEKGTLIVSIYGEIYRVNNDLGIVGINLLIPQGFYMNKSDDFILRQIENCIAHEFMHGNIYLQRMNKGVENGDIMENYDKYLTIIRERCNDPNSFLYRYAYGIYSTYYQEMQAIISQAFPQMRDIIGKPNATNEEIKSAIKQTEVYQIFSQNAYDLGIYLEKSKEDGVIWEHLIDELRKYGIEETMESLEKNIKQIIKRSNVALTKIIRNAMHYLMY